MPVHDFSAQRLFVTTPLSSGSRVPCSAEQANYLRSVLRLEAGDEILIFDGINGEWRARLAAAGKRGAELEAIEQVRAQESGPDIDFLFAPLKRARLDYMVEKAVEMGVARLRPVLTRRTVPERVNLDRMRAHTIEAAEQCGILILPQIAAPQPLLPVLEAWSDGRPLIFCDERAAVRDPVAALAGIKRGAAAVLTGPEGGFDDHERAVLLGKPFTIPISLGPRILRADTAAVAALALVNAVLGDWR